MNASSRSRGISSRLKQEEDDAEEEALRKTMKNPDTYAVVNWFSIKKAALGLPFLITYWLLFTDQ
ncbi:hypothetical protein DXI23_10065 [Marinobacter flavimaris]|uniref:Uncharacterized protein n=1 Tax=Marinobacter flavimaris TaxID=262076 RepID=A0A3D8H3C4_9GAMM|nr:hypothetical protein MDHKLMBL_08970 [Marinobacter flavimaris]RDU40879.1 hypothetical protein DXI23_10065 [Marinobacter flavimaris]